MANPFPAYRASEDDRLLSPTEEALADLREQLSDAAVFPTVALRRHLEARCEPSRLVPTTAYLDLCLEHGNDRATELVLVLIEDELQDRHRYGEAVEIALLWSDQIDGRRRAA